jgi:hypothetical protein
MPTEVDIEKAVLAGIKRTTSDMLAPVPLIGVNGIKFVGKKVAKWPKQVGVKKANHYLAQIIRMQEEIGTGGGGFRFIYAAFLQEAADILGKPALNELSMNMTEIGDDWRNFALQASRVCKERVKDDNAYQNLSELMINISDKERKLFTDLKKSV